MDAATDGLAGRPKKPGLLRAACSQGASERLCWHQYRRAARVSPCRLVVLLACCVVGLFGCEPCAISRRCACMTSPCTLTSGLSWVCSLRSFSCDALISFEGQHSNRAIRLANKTWTRATRVASLWHRGCRQPGWWALPSSGIASVQLCRVRRPIASVLSCGGWLQSISHRSSSGLLTDVSGIGYRDMCKCIITFCAISC